MLDKSLKYSQFLFFLFSSLIINSFNNLLIEIRYYVYRPRDYLIVTQLHWKEILLFYKFIKMFTYRRSNTFKNLNNL